MYFVIISASNADAVQANW